MYKQPPFLKPGDTIGICAAARKVSPEELFDGIELFKSWGFKVKETPHLYQSYHQFSGTDEQRTSDFQLLLDDPNVNAIICARGGYGCIRIIDQLDFTNFQKYPKWIIGFSDMTILHSHILNNFNIQVMHAPMVFNYSPDRFNLSSANYFKQMLTGIPVHYSINNDSKFKSLVRTGITSGILIGGNLSILYAICGSNSDLNTTDKILFLEDLDEYLYHIDRMMYQLKRSGKLAGLKGLIIGGMNDMRDNTIPFGKTAEEIIFEAVKEYQFPICYGFPAGHIPTNFALKFGSEIKLEITEEITNIYFNET